MFIGICVSSIENYVLSSLVHLGTDSFISSVSKCYSSLYILVITLLSAVLRFSHS